MSAAACRAVVRVMTSRQVVTRLGWLLAASSSVCACGATYRTDRGHAELVAPVAIAERRPDASEATPTPPRASATASNASAPKNAVAGAPRAGSPSPQGFPPDPEPLVVQQHYRYELRYDRGDIHVVAVRSVDTAKPVETQRTMGRFAFELWIGAELIDRVRFDFPLLGAEAPAEDVQPLHAPPNFAQGAVVSRSVVVPHSQRATSARIIDRATGSVTSVDWPPRNVQSSDAAQPARETRP